MSLRPPPENLARAASHAAAGAIFGARPPAPASTSANPHKTP